MKKFTTLPLGTELIIFDDGAKHFDFERFFEIVLKKLNKQS